MAFRKLFTKRFFDGVKTMMPFEHAAVSSALLPRPQIVPRPNSADGAFFRQFILLRRAVHHSGTGKLPEFLSLPVGEKLREKLQGMNNVARDRLRQVAVPNVKESEFGDGISVNDARKILRVSQMEKVKGKLRIVPESSVLYSEFLRICVEACENHDQGVEFAKILDDSGNVIVLGNTVFLRPEQVAKSIQSLICQLMAKPNDPRRKELEQMEKQKAIIDEKAKARVRAELYLGLGFLTIQTVGFMRLTFWDLSWDVMEPICFFVTSMGFGLAYLFFLKTSTEPTFQGFFRHRFKVNQERLVKTQNFDIRRYNELCKACYPNYHAGPKAEPFNYHPGQTHIRALHG